MSAESEVSHVIVEPFVILSPDIIVPSSRQILHYFCFSTCTLLMKFSKYISGVLLFWNRLAVSRFTFHVAMYMFFPVSTLNAIYFIIFRISTELLLLSILFQSYFHFIFALRLLVHCPRTSAYKILALLVIAQLSFAYDLTSYLYMYLYTSSDIESKDSGLSNGCVFISLSIIFIPSPLSYLLATYLLMRRMEVSYMSALQPVENSK